MKIIFCLLALISFHSIKAQDSVLYRLILIGDAGEIDKEQQAVIPAAAGLIIPQKTTVFYLGDNVYPRGMGLPGSPEEAESKSILQSQFNPMREKNAPVYFVPGNHDWDKEGSLGLAKIQRQGAYLNEQSDPLLKMVPANGCPDPVEIDVSPELTVIAFDSEWWLFPYDKTNKSCSCQTEDEIIVKIREIFKRNRDKTIFLACHHPFQSYGTHGGYFSWKDHIFPLTNLESYLWVPLPIVGSLYPVLRKARNSPEDLPNALYQHMIRRIDGVFDSFPNLVHVSGHDHGLQFIKSAQVQVISGAGAKQTFAKKGPNSLFAAYTQGFVTADLLLNRTMRFTYYEYQAGGIREVFRFDEPYRQPDN